MRVAVAQFSSVLDKVENRRRVSLAVAQAGEQGASLIVLPEAAMYGFGPPGSDLRPHAEPLDGPFVTTLHDVATATGSTVVAGMFEAAEDGGVCNTVVVVSAAGLLTRYRKLHLFDALGWRESDQLRAGDPERDGTTVCPVGELTVGLMTCYDVRFPELARTLIDAGATALAIPAAWVAGARKAEVWGDLVRTRAIESTAYVLAAAQPAPAYTGLSMVVDPLGEPLAVLDADTDGGASSIALAEVSAATVEDVRRRLPVLEHRRFEVRPRPAAR